MSRITPFEYAIERKVKVTENQIKKHAIQMTAEEKQLLSVLVSSLRGANFRITNHAKTHIPFLNNSLVKQTLENCDVIEFNVTNNSSRVLVRSRKQLNIIVGDNYELANVCLVIGIADCTVITAYANVKGDSHDTLNLDRYTADLDIIKYAMRN